MACVIKYGSMKLTFGECLQRLQGRQEFSYLSRHLAQWLAICSWKEIYELPDSVHALMVLNARNISDESEKLTRATVGRLICMTQ